VQRAPPTGESEELLRIAKALGVTLEMMHPDTEDIVLISYFKLEVQDFETARRLIDHLKQSSAVEAAYIKPRAELP
jgi:hypothetical protein